MSTAALPFPPDARMLFCIGAQKAGTTWLYELLRQSPECHFSKVKELHYFDVLGGVADQVYRHKLNLAATFSAKLRPEVGPVNRNMLHALRELTAQLSIHAGPIAGPHRHDAYLDYLLAGRQTEAVICDITPSYALLDSPIFADMANLGQARFVFILRDPVDRMWSQVRMAVEAQKHAPSPLADNYADACAVHARQLIVTGRLAALAQTDHAMGRADYARTITALEAVVPPDRIKYLFYEQMFSQACIDDLCDFLGIAPIIADTTRIVNQGQTAPIPADIAAAFHATLYPQYDFAQARFGDSLPQVWQDALAREPVAPALIDEISVSPLFDRQTSPAGPPLARAANKNPAPDLRPAHARLRFSTLRSIAALVMREMASTYGRSLGGYAWSVLEPALSIALLTFVFSMAFQAPPIGTNFPIFYATGFMPFMLFNDVSNKLSQAISYSKQLLSYPRVTFIDVMVARTILSVLTKLLVSLLTFAGILWVYDTGTQIDLPHVLLSFTMATALGIGVGTMNCFLMSMYPVWRPAWSIAMTPLVLISGVIILIDTLPQPLRHYLAYNPLVHITAEMRVAFYYSYTAPFISPVYVFGVSLALTAAGLLFLRRYYRIILED